MIVEVCANSLQSALNAQSAGADRIEICSELGVGGITASAGLLKKIKEAISIPVHVLIRPRSGDFTYSDMEFEIMKENIIQCREMGFDGIVSGVLESNYTLDITRTKELLDLSGELNFTFHRAFDWLKDPLTALQFLEEIGVNYILSSGQQNTALEGMSLLKQLHKSTAHCKIIPGGGINEDNAGTFAESGFEVIHLSGTKFFKSLMSLPSVSMNSATFLREDHIAITDPDQIKKILKIVK